MWVEIDSKSTWFRRATFDIIFSAYSTSRGMSVCVDRNAEVCRATSASRTALPNDHFKLINIKQAGSIGLIIE